MRRSHAQFHLESFLLSDLNPTSGTATTLFSLSETTAVQHHRFSSHSRLAQVVLRLLSISSPRRSSSGLETRWPAHEVRNRSSNSIYVDSACAASGMVSPHVQTLFDIWFSFHVVGGHFLIPVLLVTFLLSKAKRDATLINFGLTISFSSVINCLLSVVPRPRPFSSPSLTHLLQGSIHTNTLDLNQIRDCASFRPQRLEHLPPCLSFPILV